MDRDLLPFPIQDMRKWKNHLLILLYRETALDCITENND